MTGHSNTDTKPGLPDAPGPWRTAERKRLITERMDIPNETRVEYATAIAGTLKDLIGSAAGLTVSAYWPIRGEPDLRELTQWIDEQGGRFALPVVVARAQPLVFRAWRTGDPLERGVWNIPVPSAGAEVIPDVVISPLVGFDAGCYRLGYGGGFYDRTLASLERKPKVFGVGYEMARLATIHPQPHDIPMDVIVTQDGAAIIRGDANIRAKSEVDESRSRA